ncbi:MAG: hypothetical protein JSC188_000595 [Candidatus Tokpelaia sp. JSC188]|nr:MAG: hypothetical protein JSC188_000595 [Candidatus Tokpelaia sp. JSC188]
MERVDLVVPFEEKEEAKQLGARWDKTYKIWYVPEGINPDHFQRWFPETNVRSTSYFIGKNTQRCWKCKERTNVYGFYLPGGSEVFDEKREIWKERWKSLCLSYVIYLVPSVAEGIRIFSRGHYYISFSKTVEQRYWMNHCEHCKAKLGDFGIYQELDGGFCPMNKRQAAQIALHEISKPFSGYADYDTDSSFKYMRKCTD